ncbi:MAG: SDR family oxidoreductase [Pseudomonadales bacterium]
MTDSVDRGSLAGRCILVTGASSGIGQAIALALSDQGASVCFTGRNIVRLQESVAVAGKNADFVAVDLTNPEAPQVLADHVAQSFGSLHGLVLCAGSIGLNVMQQASLGDLESQVQTNVMAPYALCQRLLGALVEGQGDVVFLNSSIVHYPRANAGQFAATQHAISGIAESLRQELNPQGVRVLCVYVGRTATPRQERLYELEGRVYEPLQLMQPASVAAAVTAALTMPRDAEITELHVRPMTKS